MRLALATDLLAMSFSVGKPIFNWGLQGFQVPDLQRSLPNRTFAQTSGFLRTSDDAHDISATPSQPQLDWFVNKTAAAVALAFNATRNMTVSNVSIEFSHVDVAPNVAFDAVTLEFEVDRDLVQTNYKSQPISTKQHCGPGRARCLFEKVLFGSDPTLFDIPSQVHAFAACRNSDGTDALMVKSYFGADSSDLVRLPRVWQCDTKSRTSLFVLSVGKRLVADTLVQLPPLPARVEGAETDFAVVTQLRKIYTFTVGRLAWQVTDLAAAFQAACATGSSSACLGLQLPLLTTTAGATEQRLVVGADALPLSLLPTVDQFLQLSAVNFPLVTIHEQPRLPSLANTAIPESDRGYWSNWYNLANGDVLLPHNVRNITWTAEPSQFPQVSNSCNPDIETRLNTTLQNHIYIEHGLQPAYTAATFFLFQDATVKDAIALRSGKTTLRFQYNQQDVALWVSIPNQNAWLSFAGCAVLVVALVAALLKAAYWTPADSDPLQAITAPHLVARVMLDDQFFPPLLLHRRVLDPTNKSSATTEPRQMDQFTIDSLSVQHVQDRDRLAAIADRKSDTVV